MSHYLDCAATTRVSDAACQAVLDAMRVNYGNPSSVHRMGIDAERALESARRHLADALDCDSSAIIFTSGGTEANNLAIFQADALKRKGRHIIATSVEHKSVLSPISALEQRGFEVNLLRAGSDGLCSLDELESLIRPDTILLSMTMICNETGARMPIEQAARLLHSKNPDAIMHVDAAQGFCKEMFSPRRIGADLVTISGHKIHAPKGVGALYCGRKIKPLLNGGGQERGLRSGTEAVPAICGLGAAVQEAMQNFDAHSKHLDALRDRLLTQLFQLDGVEIIANGRTIFNLAVPKHPAEVTVRLLESRGIYVSSGAACNKGKTSHVLAAMKTDPKRAAASIRVSTSYTSTAEDIDALCNALRDIA